MVPTMAAQPGALGKLSGMRPYAVERLFQAPDAVEIHTQTSKSGPEQMDMGISQPRYDRATGKWHIVIVIAEQRPDLGLGARRHNPVPADQQRLDTRSATVKRIDRSAMEEEIKHR